MSFEDVPTAKEMLNKLNGTEIDGCVIDMRFAEDRSNTPRGGGGGGFRGRGGGGGFRGRGGRGESLCPWSYNTSPFLLCKVVVEEGEGLVVLGQEIKGPFNSLLDNACLLMTSNFILLCHVTVM